MQPRYQRYHGGLPGAHILLVGGEDRANVVGGVQRHRVPAAAALGGGVGEELLGLDLGDADSGGGEAYLWAETDEAEAYL